MRRKRHPTRYLALPLLAATMVVAPRALAAPLDNSPGSANSSSFLASAQRQFGAGNYPAAISTLRSVISRDSANAEAFYWLGRCYYEIRELDRAINHAEKSVALEPQNSVYEDWLGRDYAAKADRDKSYFVARKVKKHFEKAVELDPRNLSARRDLAEFCTQAPWSLGGSTDEAIAQIDAIAKIEPIAGHAARASFDVEALKRPDLAGNEYKQILTVKPKDAQPKDSQPYFDAIVFYQGQNKPDEMNSFLDAAARVSPDDPRLMFYRATAMIMSSTNLDRAAGYLKSYLASTPDRSEWPSHAEAREWLGRLYETQGRRMEAAEQYRASLQLDPGRSSAQTRLEKLEKESL
ncbi:MAG TPA: tetratricopeptide repeat protein [Candidatus Acidoferrales bacterium]|nr:tetratricopeptide repeat protein [Candidatus Acidoferrales bacterium]